MTPNELMDPAFLRRIPYKIEIGAPTHEEYRKIFEKVAGDHGIEVPSGLVPAIIEELQVENDFPLGCYQPRFIIDQVVAGCRFDRRPAQFSDDLVSNALANLFTSKSDRRAAAAHGTTDVSNTRQ